MTRCYQRTLILRTAATWCHPSSIDRLDPALWTSLFSRHFARVDPIDTVSVDQFSSVLLLHGELPSSSWRFLLCCHIDPIDDSLLLSILSTITSYIFLFSSACSRSSLLSKPQTFSSNRQHVAIDLRMLRPRSLPSAQPILLHQSSLMV